MLDELSPACRTYSFVATAGEMPRSPPDDTPPPHHQPLAPMDDYIEPPLRHDARRDFAADAGIGALPLAGRVAFTASRYEPKRPAAASCSGRARGSGSPDTMPSHFARTAVMPLAERDEATQSRRSLSLSPTAMMARPAPPAAARDDTPPPHADGIFLRGRHQHVMAATASQCESLARQP